LRISAVIPLLDEEPTLLELHARLSAVLKQVSPDDYEIIFANDGSTDGSAAVLEELAKSDEHVVVIELRRTSGKAAALDAAFREARGDVIVTLDADLQDVPEEVPRLLARIDAGADVVSGRKRDRRDPLTRRIASWAFNRSLSLVTGARVRDVNSGLKAARRSVIRELPLQGNLHRYIPVLAHAKGYAIEELEVSHRPRAHGRSRYGWSRYPTALLDTLTILCLTRFNKRPIQFFGVFGFSLTLLGLSILTGLSVLWFFGQPIGNRPLFTLGVLTTILGIQSIYSGVLAELVVLGNRERDAGYSIRRVIRREPLGDSSGSRTAANDRGDRGPG
jgi:dolichol-phosphate mannosyltransferase